MFNFTLHLPTKIIFGKDEIQSLSKNLPENARILLAYGGGSIKNNGVFEQVIHALEGYHYVEFSGIEPNPEYETLVKGINLVKQEKLNFILAVGGGSVLDGCKFIASAVGFEGDLWQQIIVNKAEIVQALPIGAVLTLPATGSEMNGTAVISRKSTQDKLSFRSELVKPQFSILDPTTTYSLPARQTANGVVDAFVHTLEQYLTYPVEAKIQDRFAEGVFLTLLEEGPKVLREPTNYDARANIMWAATMGLNGILGVGVPQDWAAHAIGHELTAMYGLDHAQTLAIIVPSLMEHQKESKREKLIQYAERVWHYRGSYEDEAIESAIKNTRDFFEKMGVKTRFSEYGMNSIDIEQILNKLSQHKPPLLGERKNIDSQAVEMILQAAL